MRRFNDTNRWKALRKLEPSLKNLYNYCWDMADASGVYDLDWDYLKTDIGKQYKEDHFKILEKELSNFKKIGPGKFLFTDFIFINYGRLREGYNPHKPVFRDIEKNKLEINQSLNQACFKLEDEEEYKDEEEDEEEYKGGVGEKENPKPEKLEFAQFVHMTKEEHSKLTEEHGEELTKLFIEKLDNYKASSGKKYKDDYRAILSWVVEDVKKKHKSISGFNTPKKESHVERRFNETEEIKRINEHLYGEQ